MKRMMIICSMAVLWLTQVSIAGRSLLPEPYVGISFGLKVIELDRAWSLGSHQSRVPLEAHIVY
jgi:hypothetical protein